MILPSGYVKIAIENGPFRNSGDFPINSMVDLSIVMLVYERVRSFLPEKWEMEGFLGVC